MFELYHVLIPLTFCFNASFSSVDLMSAVQGTITFESVTAVLCLKHAISIKIPVGSVIAKPLLNQDSQTVQKIKVMTINIPYYSLLVEVQGLLLQIFFHVNYTIKGNWAL